MESSAVGVDGSTSLVSVPYEKSGRTKIEGTGLGHHTTSLNTTECSRLQRSE